MDQEYLRDSIFRALDVVIDPELDEPITDLGFVHTVDVAPDTSEASAATGGRYDIEVHLRLPTSFCAPNFAYLMASDAKDVLVALNWTNEVTVELDDHHDSTIINTGLAADAGYRGTFGHEAEDDLEELRATFQRKAHTAAMERCLTALLRADPTRPMEQLGAVTIADLPDEATTDSLLRRRAAIGLPCAPDDLVMVDHLGSGFAPDAVPMALRRARSTRISIDGNAHFCRGLLRTRYVDGGSETVEQPSSLIPLSVLTH